VDEDLAREIWQQLHEASPVPNLANTARQALARSLDMADSLRATWHPLGFIMLRLGQVPEGSIRLHIWPGYYAGGDRASGSIHEHRWSLASYILCGCLENSVVKVSEISAASSRQSWRLTEITHEGHHDYVNLLGVTVQAEVVAEMAYTTGDRYFLGPRIFHQTKVLNSPCATLVGETTGVGSPSRSLSRYDGFATHTIRQVVTSTELTKALVEVVDAMVQ
jgi:hypothetical protein